MSWTRTPLLCTSSTWAAQGSLLDAAAGLRALSVLEERACCCLVGSHVYEGAHPDLKYLSTLPPVFMYSNPVACSVWHSESAVRA